jgi:hypothetical protein
LGDNYGARLYNLSVAKLAEKNAARQKYLEEQLALQEFKDSEELTFQPKVNRSSPPYVKRRHEDERFSYFCSTYDRLYYGKDKYQEIVVQRAYEVIQRWMRAWVTRRVFHIRLRKILVAQEYVRRWMSKVEVDKLRPTVENAIIEGKAVEGQNLTVHCELTRCDAERTLFIWARQAPDSDQFVTVLDTAAATRRLVGRDIGCLIRCTVIPVHPRGIRGVPATVYLGGTPGTSGEVGKICKEGEEPVRVACGEPHVSQMTLAHKPSVPTKIAPRITYAGGNQGPIGIKWLYRLSETESWKPLPPKNVKNMVYHASLMDAKKFIRVEVTPVRDDGLVGPVRHEDVSPLRIDEELMEKVQSVAAGKILRDKKSVAFVVTANGTELNLIFSKKGWSLQEGKKVYEKLAGNWKKSPAVTIEDGFQTSGLVFEHPNKSPVVVTFSNHTERDISYLLFELLHKTA